VETNRQRSEIVDLFIAITGYAPGQSDPEVIINICWAFIFIGGLGLYLLTFYRRRIFPRPPLCWPTPSKTTRSGTRFWPEQR